MRPVFLYALIGYVWLNGTVLDPHPIKMRDFAANSWQKYGLPDTVPAQCYMSGPANSPELHPHWGPNSKFTDVDMEPRLENSFGKSL